MVSVQTRCKIKLTPVEQMFDIHVTMKMTCYDFRPSRILRTSAHDSWASLMAASISSTTCE